MPEMFKAVALIGGICSIAGVLGLSRNPNAVKALALERENSVAVTLR